MVPSPQHSARPLSHTPSIVLLLVCLVFAACNTTDRNTKVLFEDQHGTVSLQTMSDQSIQATHPITLEPALIAKILRGIEVQDQERGIQKLLAGSSSSIPVFSDDQIRFLAPLLAEGLRMATPDQCVEYRAHTTQEGSFLESSTTETTAGSLYAYGRVLYVILSQYRYSPTRTHMKTGDMSHRSPLFDTSGLRNRIMLFTPSAAERSDAFDPPTGGKSTDRFLAIDYQQLQQAPPMATTTEQTKPQLDQTSPTRESPVETSIPEVSTHTTEALAQEVDALRKELKSVQQQLGNQPSKQDSPKRKTKPPAKP